MATIVTFGKIMLRLALPMIHWKAASENANWFHWTGVSPAVSPSAAAVCREGIEAARQMGRTVSCDMNYRAKLWKWGRQAGKVMRELVALSDIAIGNEEDADRGVGIQAPGADGSALHRRRREFYCRPSHNTESRASATAGKSAACPAALPKPKSCRPRNWAWKSARLSRENRPAAPASSVRFLPPAPDTV